MDNRIFNVNGLTQEMLQKTIELRFVNSGFSFGKEESLSFEGYIIDEKKGFILLKSIYSSMKDAIKFPAPVSLEIATGMIMAWLKSPEAKKVPMDGWDADADHDGDNELGWRVYCEEWGYIATEKGSIESEAIAIKPAYMWYGK